MAINSFSHFHSLSFTGLDAIDRPPRLGAIVCKVLVRDRSCHIYFRFGCDICAFSEEKYYKTAQTIEPTKAPNNNTNMRPSEAWAFSLCASLPSPLLYSTTTTYELCCHYDIQPRKIITVPSSMIELLKGLLFGWHYLCCFCLLGFVDSSPSQRQTTHGRTQQVPYFLYFKFDNRVALICILLRQK